MIRTFHAKINKKILFFSLLPATVLAIYFFWVKLPLAALCCMVFLVFVVERLIHTYYVLPMKVAYSFIRDGFPKSAGILCPTSKRWISYGRLLCPF